LLAITEPFRSRNGNNYDCVVPVSGGKDSTYQTIRMLELGLSPLYVMAATDKLSAIGRRNIENLKRQGV
jgi:tRNA(Ile)-lysidine synthase TilS/MesJ